MGVVQLAVLYTIFGLAFLTSVLNFTGALLPMHRLSWNVFVSIEAAEMKTHLLSVDFKTPEGKKYFCSGMFQLAKYNKAVKELKNYEKRLNREISDAKPWCANLTGIHSISDISERMCSPITSLLWPQFCEGFEKADDIGTAVVVAMIANFLLQAGGCFLLFDYATRNTPNRKWRGAALLFLGSIIYTTVLIIYYCQVLMFLGKYKPTGIDILILIRNKYTGIESGIIVCAVSAGLQILQLPLIPFVSADTSDESTMKMMEREASDYGATFHSAPERVAEVQVVVAPPAPPGSEPGPSATTDAELGC